ncbi:hypothetical protein GGU45_004171 [Niabella hirudinis]
MFKGLKSCLATVNSAPVFPFGYHDSCFYNKLIIIDLYIFISC